MAFGIPSCYDERREIRGLASSLQFHLKCHIDDMIVIRPSGVFAGMVVIGLADVFGNQSQVIKKLDVKACVPASFLEPRVTVFREVAPIRFKGEMHLERSLGNGIISLCSGTEDCRVGTLFHLPCSHKSLAESKGEIARLPGEGYLRHETEIETGGRRRKVHLVAEGKPWQGLV